MGSNIKLDPKAMKKLEAEIQKKLDAAQRKHPIPADATPAEQKRAIAKIAKEASRKK